MECGEAVGEATIRATALLPQGEYSVAYPYEDSRRILDSPCSASIEKASGQDTVRRPDEFRWLVVPDVAWAKARIARRYYTEKGLYILSDGAFALADSLPESLPGRVFEIELAGPFVPKRWRKELKTRGIRQLNILKRDFPLAASAVAKALGIREGGERCAAFLRTSGGLWMLLLK